MANLTQIIRTSLLFFCLGLGSTAVQAGEQMTQPDASDSDACPEFLNHTYRLLHQAKKVNLCEFSAQRALLVVNTASHCGFTPQFESLEALHKQYKDRGIAVLGFASDSFNQESKDEAEAAGICFKNFGVSFTMLAPTKVLGEAANPTFQHLNDQAGKPAWNFNKYLIDLKSGKVTRFDSKIKPMGSELERAIQTLL